MLPNPHYMDVQTEIQWTMRSVLMDWLVQVHNRFCLLPETLFLTVNYIDRFLSNKVVSIGKLQLVGATAILLASKYEEINCPSLQEIIYMVDGGYSTDEILKAERFMLTMLHFELGWPGPMSFLRRVSKADDYDLDTRTLAKYFLELTIMDERFVASPPSFLAAAAHCLSRLILRKGDWVSSPEAVQGWNHFLTTRRPRHTFITLAIPSRNYGLSFRSCWIAVRLPPTITKRSTRSTARSGSRRRPSWCSRRSTMALHCLGTATFASLLGHSSLPSPSHASKRSTRPTRFLSRPEDE